MKILRLLLASLAFTAAAKAGVTRGEIAGAKYMIAAPEPWQGKLLLMAHGTRPEDLPLDGDFDLKNRLSEELLAQGWCVAATSYRRNGWIVEDAITDLKNLRDQVVKEHGKVDRCVVLGSSMGGLIATLIAEGALEGADGVVAIGAYLGEAEGEDFYKALSFRPKVPVLYLTNETELEHPQHYRKQAGPEMTALWEIKRPGHCNVSPTEQLAGVLALDAWIDGKEMVKERDGTIPPPARESTAKKDGSGLTGQITKVAESWGNLSTDLVAEDLKALGLKLGDKAELKGPKGTLEVTLARHWSEAERGKAVVYLSPEGWLGVAINGGRASEALGVKSGDALGLGK